MQLLGSASAKPTIVFANGPWIAGLDLGKLTKELKNKLTTIKPTCQNPKPISSLHLRWVVGTYYLRQLCPEWCSQVSWNKAVEANRVRSSIQKNMLFSPLSPSSLTLRSYPSGFGKQLLKCYEERASIECPLRFKRTVDNTKSDRQIFEEMPLGDCWVDSRIHLAWAYIYSSKYLNVPDAWHNTIKQFNAELTAKVTVPEVDRTALNNLIAESNGSS